MITRFIIEVMGKPESIVEKTLKEVVKSVGGRYKIVHTEYSDVEKVEKSTLFSAFVELEFEVKNFEELFLAVIDFGPTVVEVIEPSEVKVTNTELQAALSDLVSKLHLMSKAIQTLKVENFNLKKGSDTTSK